MKQIDFSQQGGFPLEARTLNDMQIAYMQVLSALLGHLGLDEQTGSYIISGCNLVAGIIGKGVMFIDGHLCIFESVTGDENTKIGKVVVVEEAPFENGVNLPTYYDYKAITDNNGKPLKDFERLPQLPDLASVNWSEIQNVPQSLVYDTNYVHTENNFSQPLLDKLNNIEDGAQKNVQADWNATSGGAQILNKPILPKILTYKDFNVLWVGEFIFGDIKGTDDLINITFPSVGTDKYIALCSVVSLSDTQSQAGSITMPGWNWDNDFSYVIVNKSASMFQMGFREYGGVIQKLKVEFILIAL